MGLTNQTIMYLLVLYAEILQRGGGGANLGYYKKRRGAAAGRQCLKFSLVSLREARLTQGGGGECPPPPLNTPLRKDGYLCTYL